MYRITLLLVMLLNACADPDTLQQLEGCAPWGAAKMTGTTLSDELLDVVIDEHGNVYVAGYEQGISGISNIEPAGNARGIVMKYDRMGHLISQLSLDITGASVVEALAYRPDTAELFFSGRTNGAIDGYSNHGQFDVLAGWMDTDEWIPNITQFGNERPQHPRRIAAGATGELVIAGFDDTYVPANYVEAWENPLLIKLERIGDNLSEIWQQTYNTSYGDIISGLAIASDTDGAIYVIGRNDSGIARGIFVTKYDANGMLVWNRQQTGGPVDQAAAIQLLPDGNLLYAASTYELLGNTAYGQMDVVIRKLDATTGEPIWTRQFGTPDTDWATDMVVDTYGQIYVVGEIYSLTEDIPSASGDTSAFLFKFDSSGQHLMTRTWNSAGIDSPTSVAVDSCERAFIAGYTTGDLVGINRGGRDGFIIPIETHRM